MSMLYNNVTSSRSFQKIKPIFYFPVHVYTSMTPCTYTFQIKHMMSVGSGYNSFRITAQRNEATMGRKTRRERGRERGREGSRLQSDGKGAFRKIVNRWRSLLSSTDQSTVDNSFKLFQTELFLPKHMSERIFGERINQVYPRTCNAQSSWSHGRVHGTSSWKWMRKEKASKSSSKTLSDWASAGK